MAEAYIIDAVRTPRGIGKVGKGKLAHLHPQHLAATVMKALKDRNNLRTEEVDDVIWSVCTQVRTQGSDLGRMAALDAGYDVRASGVTLNRFCGGGITAVNLAAAQIMAGMEDCIVAGGTEMMSFTNSQAREEQAAGFEPLGIGAGNARLQAAHPQSNQGVAADAIATIEGFTREDLDRAGVISQERAAIAIAEGRFARSIVPVVDDDGQVILGQGRVSPTGYYARGSGSTQACLRCSDRPADEQGRGNLPPGYQPPLSGPGHPELPSRGQFLRRG
jgi:acetyl-CoA C-acetyltransferase